MRQAAVVASSLNIMGGAERVAAAATEALDEMGFDVSVLTWDAPRPSSISWNHDGVFAHVKRWNSLSMRFRSVHSLNSIDTLVCLSSSSLASLRKRYDLVMSTDLVPVIADIWYVHFPFFALAVQGFEDIARHQMSGRSRLDATRVKIGHRLFNYLLRRPLLLVNSSFTKTWVEKALNQRPVVLYPPVESADIALRTADKSDIVLSVGRFKPAKRFEVIPEIAAKVKNAKFIVAGYREIPEYVQKIKRLIRTHGLDDRVILRLNCSREEILSLMTRAKVYLHTAIHEHFGISIVEAMAARAVPVVHASGGPPIDILRTGQARVGYAYEDLDEAADQVGGLLADEARRREIAERAVVRALAFDKDVFKRKLKAIIRARGVKGDER